MPLPRKKDEGAGAPVLSILKAHVRLSDVDEKTEPYTVTRQADNASFELDPGFDVAVTIVDDNEDGADNGAKFFEKFKYKQDKAGNWALTSNSKLGRLAEVAKPGYFEDIDIPDLEASDLEGFEFVCSVQPKEDPNGRRTGGSMIDWQSMQRLKAKSSMQDYQHQASAATSSDDDEFFAGLDESNS